MRRESSEDVTAAAHRRLEQLGRELGRELISARPDLVEDVVPTETSVLPVVVRHPGRHSRRRASGLAGRIGEAVSTRLPGTALRPAHLPVLVALVTVVLGATVWSVMHGRSDPVPVARTVPATSPAAPTATTSAPAAPAADRTADPAADPARPAATPTGGFVVVDVAGKVRRPGVATLPAGARVVDALRRAGGALHGVDLSGLNLARVLVDGEQILVGKAPAVAMTDSSAAAGPASGGALVNINTADLAGLDSLPGVGPVTAQKILDWRTENGSFSSVDELLEVDGIGAKTLADLAPHVTL